MWQSTDLKGKKIAIQGLGSVGAKLAHLLFWEGAELILTDLDHETLKEMCLLYGAKQARPEEIFDTHCDIFAPCALGGILRADIIPRLHCKAVAGSANNQLRERKDGELLMQRGILHAPGFAINAGGIINVSCEFDPGGYNPRKARDKIERIFHTLTTIFKSADLEKRPPTAVADELAEYKLMHGIGKRQKPLAFV